MASGSPFFSVVIPTLNRAKYLPNAIKSVLGQTFGDFEIVVSNNSSDDNTEEVVKNFDDPRIRYVKTEHRMLMGSHWNFALSHARGEYITFLGDDDVHAKIFFEEVGKIIERHAAEIIACKICKYFFFDVNDFEGYRIERDSVLIPSFTNELRCYEPQEAIQNIFTNFQLLGRKNTDEFHTPQLVNAVYHKSLIDKSAQKLGFVFPELLAGDFYTAVTFLSFANKYCFLDTPLSINGTPENNTSFHSDKNVLDDFCRRNPEFVKLENVPLKVYNKYNCVVDTLLQAKNDLNGTLDIPKIDFTDYFIVSYFTIQKWEEDGFDVSQEKKIFFQNLDAQPEEVKQAVKERIFNWKGKIKEVFGSVLTKTGILDSYRNRNRQKKLIVSGKEKNFKNMFELSQLVDEKFLDEYVNKKAASSQNQ